MFLRPTDKRLMLVSLGLGIVGAISILLSITKMRSESIGAPHVELKRYKINKEKIVAKIEVLNVINTDIRNLLLQLQCRSANQEKFSFFILLSVRDNSTFTKGAEKIYRISHRHQLERKFAFKERREIHLEIDAGMDLALTECPGLFVFGYQ